MLYLLSSHCLFWFLSWWIWGCLVTAAEFAEFGRWVTEFVFDGIPKGVLKSTSAYYFFAFLLLAVQFN